MADSWAAARVTAVVSEDGEKVLRVIPGESIGDTYGFAGARKGKYAQGQWFRLSGDRYELYQSAQLVNPVAPMYVAVANNGAAITLDNWHNVGYGDVVAIYDPGAKLIRRYRLTDLYSRATIEKIKASVSSIWWRCVRREPIMARDGVLHVEDSFGGLFRFWLRTGEFKYEPGAGKCTE